MGVVATGPLLLFLFLSNFFSLEKGKKELFVSALFFGEFRLFFLRPSYWKVRHQPAPSFSSSSSSSSSSSFFFCFIYRLAPVKPVPLFLFARPTYLRFPDWLFVFSSFLFVSLFYFIRFCFFFVGGGGGSLRLSVVLDFVSFIVVACCSFQGPSATDSIRAAIRRATSSNSSTPPHPTPSRMRQTKASNSPLVARRHLPKNRVTNCRCAGVTGFFLPGFYEPL